MVGLGDLPGGTFDSQARGVSANGSVVVGQSNSASGREAFRWTSAGGMVGLGDLPGGSFFGRANGVSADGSVVVGLGSSAVGSEAFVWDATNGMRSIQDILTAQGVDLTGWQLTEGRAVSADGSIIVGYGTNPSGFTEAWLADLSASSEVVPEPSTFTLFGLGAVGLAGYRWRRCKLPPRG
jgi:probable HAF family extracellular repeat protein